ncbi:MAG TPA: YafY family protein [Alphaproteobacteria bacterium]|jgi:predicted DNA-binding transcriptional regulator YafY|nr:YafY family protein [Alphaproteobacteria bacterium]
MLASRLLSTLMLLQTRGRMSAAELAREAEVSIRTVYRDIDQLSAAGIPVYADRGRNGGFQLLDGYRTKLTGLTPGEAETLFLAGLPGPAAELGLGDRLAQAQLKLLAALPAGIGADAQRVAARFHLDPVGWFRGAEATDSLPTIAQAVWNERMLKLRYRNAGNIYDRLLGPLGLVLKGGVWYLIAQSGKSVRTYRVGAISNVQATDDPFDRPDDFNLQVYWAKASRDYEAGVYQETAQVRLSSKGMARLDLLGPFVVEAARRTAEPDSEGWFRCALPVESGDFGLRELLRLGEEIEVVGPPAMRERLAAILIAMTRRYIGPHA